jgi:hypothetical protein
MIDFVARCGRNALLGPAIAVAALSFLPACGLVATIGVSGRVVDRETGQPIKGAVVSLQRTAHCVSYHAYSRQLSPVETRTDGTGLFSVGSGGTAATAGCLSWAWSRSLRILAPGYLEEALHHDDSWLGADPRRQFDLLKTQSVSLEHARYALELRPYLPSSERPGAAALPVAGDPRPGPAWQDAIAAIGSAKVRPLEKVGVFARRPGMRFDQVVVVDLLRDHFSRPRAAVLARDRVTGSVHGFALDGEPVSLPLPDPGGWVIVGVSSRLGVPLLEKDSHLYFPALLDWAAPLNGLSSQNWARVATQRGALRALAANRQGWVGLEAGNTAITSYKVVEQSEGKSRLRPVVSAGPQLLFTEVLPEARAPIECLVSKRDDDSVVILARTADGHALFVLPWWRMGRNEWRADRTPIPAGILEGDVIACAASASSLYVSLRDRGIVRLSLAPPEVDPLAQARFGAMSRGVLFLGLATGSLAGADVLYAVAGDDAIYRFSATGEPDQRLELEVGPAIGPSPVR